MAGRVNFSPRRRELAHAYLSEGTASGEVAFLLAYSEQSAFHCAYRR